MVVLNALHPCNTQMIHMFSTHELYELPVITKLVKSTLLTSYTHFESATLITNARIELCFKHFVSCQIRTCMRIKCAWSHT